MPWLHQLRRQPDPDRPAEPLLPHRRQRRPLRHARAAPRRAAAPGPAHDRDGVRLGDGDPGLQGEAADRRVPDRIPPARRREQALELPRRLAPPALPARPQPQPPVHPARARCCAGLGALDPGARRVAGLDLFGRAWGMHAADRRRAADDRRHAGARARAVRARLRHLLHGRAATRGSTACGRASGSSTACCSAARSCSSASCSAPSSWPRWIAHGFGSLADERLAVVAADAAHRRHPDLLLVVPAVSILGLRRTAARTRAGAGRS